MKSIELFKDYENAKLVTAEEFVETHRDTTVKYSDLASRNIDGIPLCIRRDGEGELEVSFTPDTHLLAIGATRSGKTTGYVIPTLNVLLNKKNKPSMVISDPRSCIVPMPGSLSARATVCCCWTLQITSTATAGIP